MSYDPLLSTLVNHPPSTDDSTDELVTERGRKKTKSKKGGTKRRSVNTETG